MGMHRDANSLPCASSLLFLLRRIAGLNETKAKAILAWREEHGVFVNREELKEVKGIGSKTYEQCVGFVRIISSPPPQGNSTKSSITGQDTIIISDPDGGEKTKTHGKKRKRVSSEEQGGRKKQMKTVGSQKFRPEPLDMTWIHPESYPVTRR